MNRLKLFGKMKVIPITHREVQSHSPASVRERVVQQWMIEKGFDKPYAETMFDSALNELRFQSDADSTPEADRADATYDAFITLFGISDFDLYQEILCLL